MWVNELGSALYIGAQNGSVELAMVFLLIALIIVSMQRYSGIEPCGRGKLDENKEKGSKNCAFVS